MTEALVKQKRRTPAETRSDLELLRAYEPVLAFTEGEMFFPMHVDGYVRHCSLTARAAGGQARLLAEKGALDTTRLARIGREHQASILALQFVEEPLGGVAYRRWRADQPEFRSRGRLARVGLLGRLVDAVYRMTFLLRGRVPGGTVAGAQQQYAAIQAQQPGFVYHGRVARKSGYVVLNYQFFYAMNDWRSTFFGANDHEADWEQIFVYLAEDSDGRLEPAWVAFASHDFFGADLRRRWDDPDLTFVENHPVVFAAAGSHASYFQAGEYVTAVELRPLRPLAKLTTLLRRFWRDVLGQGEGDPGQGGDNLFKVPFVDYARGDGVRIGPGQACQWTPVVIDEAVDWVESYRGLWGLDTRDIFAGERAPAGPMYNRDGSVRQSWYDPVGWAELDREPLPAAAESEVRARIETLRREQVDTALRADEIRRLLPQLALEARALEGVPAGVAHQRQRQREIEKCEADLKQLAAREESLRQAIGACERLLQSPREGFRGGVKDPIRHEQRPEPVQSFREGRLAELWAAASIGLLLVLAATLIFIGSPWFTALILAIAAAVLVDSILRGTLVKLLLNATITLAVVTTVVLVYEGFWLLLLAGLAAAGLLVLANNLREMRSR